MLSSSPVPLKTCLVSFTDAIGLTHTAEVEADTLYEAAILGVCRLKRDPWTNPIGPSTPLHIEVREPSATHSITLGQAQRWLDATGKPSEEARKIELKKLLRSA